MRDGALRTHHGAKQNLRAQVLQEALAQQRVRIHATRAVARAAAMLRRRGRGRGRGLARRLAPQPQAAHAARCMLRPSAPACIGPWRRAATAGV